MKFVILNFYQKINSDLYGVSGDISQISEFDLFEFTAQNLEKFIVAVEVK